MRAAKQGTFPQAAARREGTDDRGGGDLRPRRPADPSGDPPVRFELPDLTDIASGQLTVLAGVRLAL